MAAVPYNPQDPQDVGRVLGALELARKYNKRGGFSVKKTTFNIGKSSSATKVDSWRMQDWDYKRQDLPIYARGLFTTRTNANENEIIVRGYDKFFNVDEVPNTKWANIFALTKPPYELTLKENGCIVFVAGLEDGTLLVCSKHSTGDRSDVQVSHASAAEERLGRQLSAIGRTKVDLARELRQRNATAVAELCDDAFEEHILAYTSNNAGLYLHGINLNVSSFTTYPSSLVQEFADSWGFKRTGLIVMNNIHEVKIFLEEVAQTGAYDGRDIEGFVIRCKIANDPTLSLYRDWFFKYKFEEPYLMYRQWRECTKALITGKQPKYKKHVMITEQYLQYARQRLVADPGLGRLYSQNHGIIALRNDFLSFKKLDGADAANLDHQDLLVLPDVMKGVILCPVATIGCGKTTVALALVDIFGWGHVQNDDILGKGRPPRFTSAVLGELNDHPVVFADRNNAQRHERKQLLADVKRQDPSIKVVCLNFRHDQDSMHDIRRVTRERVLGRGDNHQTIHAASDRNKYISVMEGFYSRFEACNPHSHPDIGFDVIINLDPTASSRWNLETTIQTLHQNFPKLVPEMPSAEKLNAAIDSALSYQPQAQHDIADRRNMRKKGEPQQLKSKRTKGRLEYMSVDLRSQDVNEVLEQAFGACEAQASGFYQQLKETRRLQDKFHVTLMHRATSKENPELWRRYTQLHETNGNSDAKLGDCDLIFERVVFDDRIMAIVVRLLSEQSQWQCANRVAHVTIGTRDEGVKPKESNSLLEQWLATGMSAENKIEEVVFEEKPIIRGEIRGVLSS